MVKLKMKTMQECTGNVNDSEVCLITTSFMEFSIAGHRLPTISFEQSLTFNSFFQ